MIVLITGASGCGKTTVTRGLSDLATIYYFDDIGVPEAKAMIDQYGSPENWQEWATHAWIKKLYNQDKQLVVLEGSFNPEFAIYKLKELGINHYQIICLSTKRSIREQRLIDRKQPELVSQDMENFARILEEKTIASNGMIIDTSDKSINEVVEEIKSLIDKKGQK